MYSKMWLIWVNYRWWMMWGVCGISLFFVNYNVVKDWYLVVILGIVLRGDVNDKLFGL